MMLEIHQNESQRQAEFPVCRDSIFLAHAAVCPLPARVAAAMSNYAAACTRGDQEEVFPHGQVLETRKLASQLLGCTPHEIALIGPTSAGLSLVAEGLEWQPGDNLVYYSNDYPSNVAPWMAVGNKGVQLRRVQPKQLGAITLEDLIPLVDSKTRLVALASAHFVSGWRLSLDEIGQWVRSQGALFCVDGIQTLGALKTSVAHVDFLAADAHKWLLGPCAAGILYVRRESQQKLHPKAFGWNNVKCPGYVMPDQIEMPDHAGKYEAGSHNLIGMTGLNAAMSLLLEQRIDVIEETISNHVRFLRAELESRDFELENKEGINLSGIVSFRKKDDDLAALHQKLQTAKIITSLRQTREGTQWIRLSPHFYNTRKELEKFIGFLS
jgi:cysteine desulfurase / selenocysteine lyase